MIPLALPSSQEKMDDNTKDKASDDPAKSITQSSSSENDNIVIKVPRSAVARVQGAEIQCDDGGEITVSTSSGSRLSYNSKRESDIKQQTWNVHDGTHDAPKLPETNAELTTQTSAPLHTSDDGISTRITQSDTHGMNVGLKRRSPTHSQSSSQYGTDENDSASISDGKGPASSLSVLASRTLPASTIMGDFNMHLKPPAILWCRILASLLSRLCGECISAMKLALTDPSSKKILSTPFLKSLDRSRSTLILWSDGYGVVNGDLDEVVAKSPLLRLKLSEFLVNIGTILTKGIIPRLGLDRTVQARVLKRLAKESSFYCHDKALGEVSESDSDYDEDNCESGSDSEQSSDSECDDMGDYAREIETDVECLLELDAFIRTPTLDLKETHVEDILEPDPDPGLRQSTLDVEAKVTEGPHSVIYGGLRLIHSTFSSLFFVLIKDRFPEAPFDVAMALSSAYMNYLAERQRLETDKHNNTTITKDLPPISEPYFPEDGSPRIPSFPGGGIRFAPFKCPICREFHHFSSDFDWQQHAFNDMKLWVCHEQECKRRSKPFTTPTDWASHLETEHAYGPSWPPITCTFCHEKTGSGKSSICLHLDSHFKETCLDATEAVVRYQGLSTKSKNIRMKLRVAALKEKMIRKDQVRDTKIRGESSKRPFDMEERPVKPKELTKTAKSEEKGKAIMDAVKVEDFSDNSDQGLNERDEDSDRIEVGWSTRDGPSTIRNRQSEVSELTSLLRRTVEPRDSAMKTGKTTSAMPTSRQLQGFRDDVQCSQYHTSDQLNSTGDECLPRKIDILGEKKVNANGKLQGGREYKCRTFLLPGRGDELFMFASECAETLGYRDWYPLFAKNESICMRFTNLADRVNLVRQNIIPPLHPVTIVVVTARSMFQHFGSRVIVDGELLRDDYWESRAQLEEKKSKRGRGTPIQSPKPSPVD